MNKIDIFIHNDSVIPHKHKEWTNKVKNHNPTALMKRFNNKSRSKWIEKCVLVQLKWLDGTRRKKSTSTIAIKFGWGLRWRLNVLKESKQQMAKEYRKTVKIHWKQRFCEDAHRTRNYNLQLQAWLMVPGCDPLHSCLWQC